MGPSGWQRISIDRISSKQDETFFSVFSHYLIDLMVVELNRVPQKLIHDYSRNQNLFLHYKPIKDDSQF